MKTVKRIFHVAREEINYIRYTLEGYDGMAVVSTIDPYAAFIEISISPGCEEFIYELIDSLTIEEGLYIREAPLSDPIRDSVDSAGEFG